MGRRDEKKGEKDGGKEEERREGGRKGREKWERERRERGKREKGGLRGRRREEEEIGRKIVGRGDESQRKILTCLVDTLTSHKYQREMKQNKE